MGRFLAGFGVGASALVAAAAIAWGQPAAAGDPRLHRVGTFVSPVYVTAPPGDRRRLFVVEQPGTIRVFRDGIRLARPFLDIRPLVVAGGERGLLSMAFPPDYESSGLFYVYYTARSPQGTLTVAEYRRSASPERADPRSRRVVLTIPHPRGNHNGGQLQFGPDGLLWIGTGDGGGAGDPDRAGQRLDTLLGKLLRIAPRPAGGAPYSAPGDNPFVGRAGARPEIWAYGLRNPWRFSFDRETNDLLIGDVGQGAWEEIDFAPRVSGWGRGANYGWSCWEGRHRFDGADGNPQCAPAPVQTPPSHQYSHDRGCSVTGGYVVRDPDVPSLRGRYVYGDYCDNQLWSVRPDGGDDRRLPLVVRGVTSFGEDACGRVYAVSGDGPVYLLREEGRSATTGCPLPRTVRRCRVPRVVGLRLAVARARILRANCRVGRVVRTRSARPGGRVVRQRPRAGANLARGARVHLTVSRGRR